MSIIKIVKCSQKISVLCKFSLLFSVAIFNSCYFKILGAFAGRKGYITGALRLVHPDLWIPSWTFGDNPKDIFHHYHHYPLSFYACDIMRFLLIQNWNLIKINGMNMEIEKPDFPQNQSFDNFCDHLIS